MQPVKLKQKISANGYCYLRPSLKETYLEIIVHFHAKINLRLKFIFIRQFSSFLLKFDNVRLWSIFSLIKIRAWFAVKDSCQSLKKLKTRPVAPPVPPTPLTLIRCL